MTDQIPIFPKATSMFVHSGNIINWNRLKRKPNLSPTDELCDCISKSLDDYLKSADKTQLQYVTEIYKVNNDNVEKLDDNEREDVKITVKVFLSVPQPPEAVKEAVDKVLNELGTSYVETVLLAVSPCIEEDDPDYLRKKHEDDSVICCDCSQSSPYQHYKLSSVKLDGLDLALALSPTHSDARPPRITTPEQQPAAMDRLKPYWEVMEQLVKDDKVLSLGVCDLNKEVLQDLYTWAKVKPVVNQVNLESCCVMPKDLVDYAKQVSVQLLTHNDSSVFIPCERLQQTVQAVSTERDSHAWSPQWAVRYSGIIKQRGIIKMKGYVFHATRDNKKRL